MMSSQERFGGELSNSTKEQVREQISELSEGDRVEVEWTHKNGNECGPHAGTVHAVNQSELDGVDRVANVEIRLDGWDHESGSGDSVKVFRVDWITLLAKFAWTGRKWNGGSKWRVTGIQKVGADGGLSADEVREILNASHVTLPERVEITEDTDDDGEQVFTVTGRRDDRNSVMAALRTTDRLYGASHWNLYHDRDGYSMKVKEHER